jgi:hypothetical protein
MTKPLVLVFPVLVVCLDCGFAEFIISQPQLAQLEDGASALA